MDFYRLSKINYINFSREGSFAKLQAAVGKQADETWNDDERIDFSSIYSRFTAAFESNGGKNFGSRPGTPFLLFFRCTATAT